MLPKEIQVSGFSVTGLSVRTINRDEFNPTTAQLPMLWRRFFESGVIDQISNSVPNSPIYGVYSEYESDATGFYSLTAGVATIGTTTSDFTTVDVQSGKYLVFEKRGQMPQAVVDAWGEVWAFFETNHDFIRTFNSDFEEYRGPDGIAIHIGVRG
jgi:predicted transcriptional regulator YdeE